MKTSLLPFLAVLAVLAAPALSFAKAPAPLSLQTELSHPLLPFGEKQTAYLKISVTGGDAPTESQRAPINVAIVLDRSSSMSGEKIARARDAAKIAVARLQSEDTVAIISYGDVVEVLVPATKLTDKKFVYDAIDKINPNGFTALFAGVSKGAEELRKFKKAEAINRVILLSDGQANVSHDRPAQVITRDELYNHAWGLDYFPNSRSLDQHISQLRKKVEPDPADPEIIKTVHGAGYRYQ